MTKQYSPQQLTIFILSLLLLVVATLATLIITYQDAQLKKALTSSPKPSPQPSTTAKPQPTTTPIPSNSPLPAPSNNPNTTQTSPSTPPSSIPTVDAPKLIRHLIAEFEKYHASQNTAGALTLFTPPETTEQQARYDSLRTLDTPYNITAWFYYINDDDQMLETIESGYRTKIWEYRDGNATLLTLEVTLVNNSFLINKFYLDSATNSDADLKYQGFSF